MWRVNLSIRKPWTVILASPCTSFPCSFGRVGLTVPSHPHPRKGKPVVKLGRKTMGSTNIVRVIARFPKGDRVVGVCSLSHGTNKRTMTRHDDIK
jgi:hypothetical protein